MFAFNLQSIANASACQSVNAAQLLASRFQHASRETIRVNSTNLVDIHSQKEITEILDSEPQRKIRQPNKTEQRFLNLLEAKLKRGEIQSYRYEGLSLKWGGNMSYTPDAVVIPLTGKWIMIEVKGKHEWSRDVVRWKGCRAEWSELEFQYWREVDRVWRRIM